MKTDQSVSTICRQLRSSFTRADIQPSHFRPLSQLAATNHPISSKQQLFTSHLRRLSAQPRRPLPFIHNRHQSSATVPPPSSVPGTPAQKPSAYELTFTCKPCLHRSTHNISTQGYHHGTVMITCPNCKARHVISDHLKIFADKSFTIEDLMRQKGHIVRKGSLEGDVEIWDDGTKVERGSHERDILKLSKGLNESGTGAKESK